VVYDVSGCVFRVSCLCGASDLEIKVEADGTRTHLTDEDAWDATWRRIYKLRLDNPTGRYECGHTIAYG